MSIADKVIQLKEDFDAVYAAGKASGGVDYLSLAKTVQFNSLNDFGKTEVELNLDNCTTLYWFCRVVTENYRNTTLEHLTINNALPTDMRGFLMCGYGERDLTLKRVTLNFDTSNVTHISNAFECMSGLEVIDGNPLDLSSVIDVLNMFNYNNALKEVRFVPNTIPLGLSFKPCPLLSNESIQSIIDGLADLTGGTAQTLTVHQDVRNKLTTEQLDQIANKNWLISPQTSTT